MDAVDHVVLGAGAVGLAAVEALVRRGQSVRVVNDEGARACSRGRPRPRQVAHHGRTPRLDGAAVAVAHRKRGTRGLHDQRGAGDGRHRVVRRPGERLIAP
jgi:hypothetical protein